MGSADWRRSRPNVLNRLRVSGLAVSRRAGPAASDGALDRHSLHGQCVQARVRRWHDPRGRHLVVALAAALLRARAVVVVRVVAPEGEANSDNEESEEEYTKEDKDDEVIIVGRVRDCVDLVHGREWVGQRRRRNRRRRAERSMCRRCGCQALP
jgi:hypothetical protein